jgi:rare lipoprotein A
MCWAGVSLGLISLVACNNVKAAEKDKVLETQFGDATFYAKRFHGSLTASGVKFDNRKAVAAHRSYPFGTVVRVTNLENGKAVRVVIVDRGPYGKNHREGAIIDLSRATATQLGAIRAGQVRVKVEVLAWGDGNLRDQARKQR